MRGRENKMRRKISSQNSFISASHKVSSVFVLIKPDGVERDLNEAILNRLTNTGLNLVAKKWMKVTPDLAELHYRQKDGNVRRSYAPLKYIKRYLTSGKVFAMVWSGENAIQQIRSVVGDYTDPIKCRIGTIRRDFGIDSVRKAEAEERAVNNLIHASRSDYSAKRELGLWFPELNERKRIEA